MAYSIRCVDAGTDCPGSFTTETKEELMKHVELHANERERFWIAPRWCALRASLLFAHCPSRFERSNITL